MDNQLHANNVDVDAEQKMVMINLLSRLLKIENGKSLLLNNILSK